MGTYAPIDYVIYIAILGALYFVFKRVIMPRVRIDRFFVLSIAPFALSGILIRVLTDVSFSYSDLLVFERSKFWSITPGVYIVMFILCLFFILFGLFLENKGEKKKRPTYWRVPFTVGLVLCLILAAFLTPYINHFDRIIHPLALAFSITLLLYFFAVAFKVELFKNFGNLSCVFAHMIDSAATFIAYNYYSFSEEHILPQYLISFFGDNALVMIPAKFILVVLLLYFLEKQTFNSSNERTAIKILIVILGAGPGLRNVLLPSLI